MLIFRIAHQLNYCVAYKGKIGNIIIYNRIATLTHLKDAIERLIVDFMVCTLDDFKDYFLDCTWIDFAYYSLRKNHSYKDYHFEVDWDCSFSTLLGCTLVDFKTAVVIFKITIGDYLEQFFARIFGLYFGLIQFVSYIRYELFLATFSLFEVVDQDQFP